MNTIFWNCQGLLSSLTTRHLKDITRGHKPDIIYVAERKNGKAFCERINEHVGMKNAFYVEPQGLSEGLTLWRTDDTNITILGSNYNFIDCEVRSNYIPTPMWATWIHVDAESIRRQLLWNSLRRFGCGRSNMWMCIGDFNDIISDYEK